jgi:transcription initiation factor TFIIIB Brf1 subunit/transcription initiation factor TFIIB
MMMQYAERLTFKGEWRHAAGIAVIFCYFARRRQNCLRTGMEVAEAGKTDAKL